MSPDRPFMLFWAPVAMHSPHQAPPEYIPVSNKYAVKNHFPYTGELDKVVVRLTDQDAFEHSREAEVTSGF